MLIETLHTMMIGGFVAVWLLVLYVMMREMSRKRSSSHGVDHRVDATHTTAFASPHARVHRTESGKGAKTDQQ